MRFILANGDFLDLGDVLIPPAGAHVNVDGRALIVDGPAQFLYSTSRPGSSTVVVRVSERTADE